MGLVFRCVGVFIIGDEGNWSGKGILTAVSFHGEVNAVLPAGIGCCCS